MCVPEIIKSDISPDDIEAEQNDNETLVKIRSMVGQEEVDSKVSYIRKRGIIYRVFQTDKSGNGKRFTQLVVPKRFKKQSSFACT